MLSDSSQFRSLLTSNCCLSKCCYYPSSISNKDLFRLHDLDKRRLFLSFLNQQITQCLLQININSTIEISGSLSTHLTFSYSDIDISIIISNFNNKQLNFIENKTRYLLDHIALHLRKFKRFSPPNGGILCLTRPSIRVPLIKLQDDEYHLSADIKLDLIINNCDRLKSFLIREYLACDERLHSLIMLIKYYAFRRGINDASQHTLNSFSWTLMVIQAMQCIQPSVLPILDTHDIQLNAEIPQGECNVWDYEEFIERKHNFEKENMFSNATTDTSQFHYASKWKSENHLPVNVLFRFFFDFYVNGFNPLFHTISIRTGKLLSRNESLINQQAQFAIEDPFDEMDNTARSINVSGKTLIMTELQRAHRLLNGENISSPEELTFSEEPSTPVKSTSPDNSTDSSPSTPICDTNTDAICTMCSDSVFRQLTLPVFQRHGKVNHVIKANQVRAFRKVSAVVPFADNKAYQSAFPSLNAPLRSASAPVNILNTSLTPTNSFQQSEIPFLLTQSSQSPSWAGIFNRSTSIPTTHPQSSSRQLFSPQISSSQSHNC